MKLNIIGVGRVGSTVAFATAILLRPEVIRLEDVRSLEGDALDLEHAIKGMSIKTKITTEPIEPDFTIISAGISIKVGVTHDDIYEVNKTIVDNSIRFTNSPGKNIIVLTNPSLRIVEALKTDYPDYNMMHVEDILNKFRGGMELGSKIVATKGYTNFGVAIACVQKIVDVYGKIQRKENTSTN